RPHGDHGLRRRDPPALRRARAAAAAGRLAAGLPAQGGRLGQGRRRQHRLLAVCRAAALPRHEPVPLWGRRAFPRRRAAQEISRGVQRATGVAVDQAAAGDGTPAVVPCEALTTPTPPLPWGEEGKETRKPFGSFFSYCSPSSPFR